MKTYQYCCRLFCAIIFVFCGQLQSSAQCAGGRPGGTITYQIQLVGGGNNNFNFSLPQFDPSAGTLVQVTIETVMTVKYSYRLENTDTVPINYKVRVSRNDDINSAALSFPISNSEIRTIATHTLAAFDGVTGSGTDFISAGPVYVYNKYPSNYTYGSGITGFLGVGNVPFNYTTVTDSYPSGSSYFLYNTSATDSMLFKLTYSYCATGALPIEISNFSAVKQSPGQVSLSWLSSNEDLSSVYDVEVSSDGINFSTIQSLKAQSNSSSSYQLFYTPTAAENAKLYFRVKQKDRDGQVKYSTVRTVVMNIGENQTVKIYPTVVTNSLNIYLPGNRKENWRVTLFSLTGQRLQESAYTQAAFIKFNFNKPLTPGIYLARVENLAKKESFVTKILVQ